MSRNKRDEVSNRAGTKIRISRKQGYKKRGTFVFVPLCGDTLVLSDEL
jgi:hypothetical protein